MFSQINNNSCANVEELKNFIVQVALAPHDQIMNSNIYNGLINQNQIQPRIEKLQNNTLRVSFITNFGNILSFYLQIQKKNPSAVLEVKNMNGVNRINSNIVFHSDFKNFQNPTANFTNSLKYCSVNHYFSFNKEKDQFSVNLSIENPFFISQFEYSFFFGQFEKRDLITVPQEQIVVSVKHEQNDDNNHNLKFYTSPMNNRQHQDDLQSTKSHSHHQDETICQATFPVPPFFTTTPTNKNQVDQMKIEENEDSGNFKIRQRRQSKTCSISNIHNNIDESSCTQLQDDKKSKFDKKNVVKNFVKAFDGYFLDSHNDQELMKRFDIDSREVLKRKRQSYEKLEKSMKYNNKMIIAIIYSEFKDIFQYFLTYEADKWICNSSVFDKEAHRTILRDYIRAAENPRDIPKIVNLRIRNREPTNKYSL